MNRINFLKKSQPYLLAIFVAIVTGLVTNYINTSNHEKKLLAEIENNNYQLKKRAYLTFIENFERNDNFKIQEFLNIIYLFKTSISDTAIQDIEDRIAHQVEANHDNEIYLSLGKELRILKIGGSEIIKSYVEDILNVINNNFHESQLSNYPDNMKSKYMSWKQVNNGSTFGLEVKVSPEERFNTIFIGILLETLFETMENELLK